MGNRSSVQQQAAFYQPQQTKLYPQGIFSGTSLFFVTGIFAVGLFGLFAIFTVPNDVMPPGAVRVSALYMIIGLILPFLIKIWLKPYAVFDPINIAVAAPVYWALLDPLQGSYDLFGIRPDDVRMAFICIILYAAGVYSASIHKPWRLPRIVWQAARIELSARALFYIATLSFILAFLRFAIPSKFNLLLMWESLFVDRWSAPWGRGHVGGVDAFLDHMAYFGYILPTLVVLLARKKTWLHPLTKWALAYAVIITALLAQGGGRRVVGVVLGSAFVVWFLTAKKPSLGKLAIFALLAAVLLWLLQIMINFRNVGIGVAFTEEVTPEERRMEGIRVDDNFLRLCQIVHIIPHDVDHVGIQWLIWVLVRPIPRVLWPGKPLTPGFDLAEYLGHKDTSLSTSLVAELYMAFGLMGCLIGGWVIGRIAVTLRYIMQPDRPLGAQVIFGIGLLALFAGMRSGIELILMSYGILAWIGLIWLYNKRTA
jgi:hypothetical protein